MWQALLCAIGITVNVIDKNPYPCKSGGFLSRGKEESEDRLYAINLVNKKAIKK